MLDEVPIILQIYFAYFVNGTLKRGDILELAPEYAVYVHN